ncbi:16S rRNA (guanine(527)-N(7))-methyltransferase RsmG [Mycobacterium sp. MS1601]|nr:16S rRNA (guanine(527)-N(7))-methyltransferase RsmG [Mycobacterium sp. MS1601]
MKHDHAASAPAAAADVFGGRLPLAQRYVEILATDGVERGLIGPRESERLWDRHVLNSAAIAELIAEGQRGADVGSGAGLPGIPLAIARPDLDITLIEPMLRRTVFLEFVIEELGLESVRVSRHRAEEPAARANSDFDFVTSRAVASLDKLTRWTAPLLKADGLMLALKGDRAESEIDEHGRVMTTLGVVDAKVMRCGVEYLDPPATVVVARRTAESRHRQRKPSGRRGR